MIYGNVFDIVPRMKTMIEKDGYSCVLLEKTKPEDFTLYHTARTLCYRDKTSDEIPNIDELNELIRIVGSEQYWKNEFKKETQNAFVVLNPENDIAGFSLIESKLGSPKFQGVHILTPYRGHHHSDLLYEAMLKHLIENTTRSRASLSILPTNEASIKAAIRNGFTLERKLDFSPGRVENIYHCNLDKLRPTKPQSQETKASLGTFHFGIS